MPTPLRFLRSNLLPIEWVVALNVLIALFGNIFLDFPLLNPGIYALGLYCVYFIPSLLICTAFYRRAKNHSHQNSWVIARIYLCFLIGSYLIYTIKHWSHLLNHQYYDAMYHQWDLWLAPLIHAERAISDWVGIPVSIEQYVLIFQCIFYLAIPVCFFAGAQKFHACITAFAVNLLIGGLSYSIAPAFGPFIYWPQEQWHKIFHVFLNATNAFQASHGGSYQPQYFMFSLGAMPSMHVCIPLTFSYYMWKTHKLWGAIGLLITLYCFMHAKFTGFHYYADLLAGILIAILSIGIANWLTARYLRHNAAYQAKQP